MKPVIAASSHSGRAGQWVVPVVFSFAVHATMVAGSYAWSRTETPPVAPAHFVVELVAVEDRSGARLTREPVEAMAVARPRAAMAPSPTAPKKPKNLATPMVQQVSTAVSDASAASKEIAPVPARDTNTDTAGNMVPRTKPETPPPPALETSAARNRTTTNPPKPATRLTLVTNPKPVREVLPVRPMRFAPLPKRKPARPVLSAAKPASQRLPVATRGEKPAETTDQGLFPEVTAQGARSTEPDSDDVASAASTGAASAKLVPPRYAAPGHGNPLPSYPRLARRRSLEGRLVLKVVIDREGRVDTIDVARSSGHPILDRAAKSAVRQWKFEPGRRAGIPVRAAIDIPVVFRLKQ